MIACFVNVDHKRLETHGASFSENPFLCGIRSDRCVLSAVFYNAVQTGPVMKYRMLEDVMKREADLCELFFVPVNLPHRQASTVLYWIA